MKLDCWIVNVNKRCHQNMGSKHWILNGSIKSKGQKNQQEINIGRLITSDNTRRLSKILKYHTAITMGKNDHLIKEKTIGLENIATKMILKYYEENSISN